MLVLERAQVEGVALVDYTGDGWPDLALASWGGVSLWRNQGGQTFVADNQRAELPRSAAARAMSPVFADVDGDGDLDLFVTTMGDVDRLFENIGGGVFRDVTAAAGLDRFTTAFGATFADLDGDGDLDIHVAVGHYAPNVALPMPGLIEPEPFPPAPCAGSRRGGQPFPAGCEKGRRGAPNVVWRNEGGLRFVEVSELWGLGGGAMDETFGALAFDADSDGDPDLLVARDHRVGRYYRNDGGGSFTEVEGAVPKAASSMMGLDLGDWDGDGTVEVYATTDRPDVLLSYSAGGFTDHLASAIGDGVNQSAITTGWGCALVDLDHDGDPDVITTSAMTTASLVPTPIFHTGVMIVLENLGTGLLKDSALDVSDSAFMAEPALLDGRGLAVADIDRDGDLDVFVTVRPIPNNGQGAPDDTRLECLLLRNDSAVTGSRGAAMLHLRQPGTANPFAVGARVNVRVKDRNQTRFVLAGASFLSANTYVLHFGLDGEPGPSSVHVVWPDGVGEKFTGVGVGEFLLERGSGLAEPAPTK